MKILLLTSLFFLFIPYFGKSHLPEFFGSPYIQWSSVVIVVSTVSIGFAKSLSDCIKKENINFNALSVPIIFLFIYCFLVGSQLPIHQIRNIAPERLEIFSETEILNGLTTGKTSEHRRKMALLVYLETGKLVPYLEDNNTYKILVPTSEEEIIFEESNRVRDETKYLKKQMVRLSQETTYLQAIELLLFWILVSGTLLIENIRKNS